MMLELCNKGQLGFLA